MKLNNISDIDGFFKVVDSCKGKVEMVLEDGSRLNLKSNLCKYVGLAKAFSDGAIGEVQILTYEPEDLGKFVTFMISGK